jgi:hypothetical protein
MANLKKRMHFINVLLDKWLKSDKMNDQELGGKVRQWYWQNEHRVEHWMIDEGNVPYEEGGDLMEDGSRYDDGEDEIY